MKSLINISVIFCVLLKCVVGDKQFDTDQNIALLDTTAIVFPSMLTNSRYSYFDEPMSHYPEGSYKPPDYWSYAQYLHLLYEAEPSRPPPPPPNKLYSEHNENKVLIRLPRKGPPQNRGPPENRGPPPNRGPPANRGPPENRGPPANRGPPPNRGPPHNREPEPINNEDFFYPPPPPVEPNEDDRQPVPNHNNIYYYYQEKVTSTSPLPNYTNANIKNNNSGKYQNSSADRFFFQAQPVVPEE